MGQPNTQALNGGCPCMAGFLKLEGCCLSNWFDLFIVHLFLLILKLALLIKVNLKLQVKIKLLHIYNKN